MAPRKSGRTHLKVRVAQDGGMAQDDNCPSDDDNYPPDYANYPPDYAIYPSDDADYPSDDANYSLYDADADDTGKGAVSRAISTIAQYFEENAPVFRELKKLRRKGWDSSEADQFFEKQRRKADENSKKTVKRFKKITAIVANDMQDFNGAFTIKQQEQKQFILDLCMAPGIYLRKALARNPTARAIAFTLPASQGGLRTFMNRTKILDIHFLDITMLAADMGIEPDEIPPSHPEADSFIHTRYLDDGRIFDLVLCDGVECRARRRTGHHSFKRKSRRLLLAQLVLGLENLWPGGTMIVLLRKFERINTVRLLHTFSSFATVDLYKHKRIHAKRSSFYMIASKIQSTGEEALQAVQEWKRDWKISTLGTKEERRDDDARVAPFGDLDVEGFLEEFGPKLVELGNPVWEIQADALKRAPFMKE